MCKEKVKTVLKHARILENLSNTILRIFFRREGEGNPKSAKLFSTKYAKYLKAPREDTKYYVLLYYVNHFAKNR